MSAPLERTRAIVLAPGLAERFWLKVNKGGPAPAHAPHLGPCWLWTGKRQNGGYGVIHRGVAHNDTAYAHRLSYLIATGVDPVGRAVCHHCDAPSCVNPEHLFLGTMADNVRDMITKGRKAMVPPVTYVRGERVAGAKLTEAKVIEIRARAAAGEGSGGLAQEFGVDSSTVRQIVRRVTWRHIGAAA